MAGEDTLLQLASPPGLENFQTTFRLRVFQDFEGTASLPKTGSTRCDGRAAS